MTDTFMKCRILGAMVAAIVAAMLCACVGDGADEPADGGDVVAVGERVPSFSVTLSDGSEFSTSNLGGLTTVIIFFDTTCSDCRRELPRFQQQYEESDPLTTRFVCIARDEDASVVAAYWSTHNLTMPWGAPGNRSIYALFATAGVPRVYEVSPAGVITKAFVLG